MPPEGYSAAGASKIYDSGPLVAAVTSLTVDLTVLRAPIYEMHLHVKQAGSGSVYSLRPNGVTTNTDEGAIYRDRGGAVAGADVNPGWQLGGVSANDELDCWVQIYAEPGMRRVCRIWTTIFENATNRTLRDQLFVGWYNNTVNTFDSLLINSDTAANGIGIGSIVRAWAIG